MGIPLALEETKTLIDTSGEGGLIVLGVGLGFVAIWLIDLLVTRGRPGGWWPLIPGVICVLVGVSIIMENQEWLESIGQWWPLIFIFVGVAILVDRMRQPRT